MTEKNVISFFREHVDVDLGEKVAHVLIGSGNDGKIYKAESIHDVKLVALYDSFVERTAGQMHDGQVLEPVMRENALVYSYRDNRTDGQVVLQLNYDPKGDIFRAAIRLIPGNYAVKLPQGSDPDKQLEKMLNHLVKPQQIAQKKSSRRWRAVQLDESDEDLEPVLNEDEFDDEQ